MRPDDLKKLLDRVASGQTSPTDALERLAHWPFEDLGETRLDHHRVLRRGFPEAVFGEGKSPEQMVKILAAFDRQKIPALITRLDEEKAEKVRLDFPDFCYHARPRLGYLGPEPGEGTGRVVVISGGTSDGPVAEEAALTARYLGARAELFEDVGVAGLHRLTALLPQLREATVIVAVAGMEGALPSVVAGLTGALVIGVPTSVGYGVQDHGRTPLFSMLASCVPGLLVVNVDGGFPAGYAAALVNRMTADPYAPTATQPQL
jgi:NCAIR mutase (PurE)-related protein